MSTPPYFNFWVQDFVDAVRRKGLTPQQTAALTMVMCNQWQNQGSISLDPRKFAAYTGWDIRVARRMLTDLVALDVIQADETGQQSPRMTSEIEKYCAKVAEKEKRKLEKSEKSERIVEEVRDYSQRSSDDLFEKSNQINKNSEKIPIDSESDSDSERKKEKRRHATDVARPLPEVLGLNGSTTAIAERIASSPDPKQALKDLTKIVSALTPKTEPEAKDKQGTRLKSDWVLSKRLGDWAIEYYQITPDQVRKEATNFRDWWSAQAGSKGRKLDWDLTWMSWIRRSYKAKKAEAAPVADDLETYMAGQAPAKTYEQTLGETHAKNRAKKEAARLEAEERFRLAEEKRLADQGDNPF